MSPLQPIFIFRPAWGASKVSKEGIFLQKFQAQPNKAITINAYTGLWKKEKRRKNKSPIVAQKYMIPDWALLGRGQSSLLKSNLTGYRSIWLVDSPNLKSKLWINSTQPHLWWECFQPKIKLSPIQSCKLQILFCIYAWSKDLESWSISRRTLKSSRASKNFLLRLFSLLSLAT